MESRLMPIGTEQIKLESPFRTAGRRARHAFTLIELLIIIAILAILASVLAPVFAEAREQVRSYMCLSNLRQIGMATMLYQQDYDEMYASISAEPYHWIPDLHEPYIK